MSADEPNAATPVAPPEDDSGEEAQLAPPDPGAALTLSAPAAVPAIAKASASGMVPLDQAAVPGLDKMVADYVDGIVALDQNSPEFSEKAESIRTMGDADVRAAASVSNRILDAPMRNATKGGFDAGSKVSSALVELRRQVEDLDPSKASGKRKLFGIIPFGDKLRDYFRRYESAQTHFNAILNAMYQGQDTLRKDNAALQQEKVNLWETMQRLDQYVYVAEHLDHALAAKIAEIETSDADRARDLRDNVLFYVRQKHQDLLTQLAISIQGYLAIDLVRRSNVELIKGVDRAATTTISALRTAVIVAQALANQKLVLDQINALNETTSNLIESTSQLLATQTAAINEQAASSTIGIDKLQAAFTNIYQTMDEIDSFKVKALDNMQTTINTLTTEIQKAQEYVATVKKPELENPAAASRSGELELPGKQ